MLADRVRMGSKPKGGPRPFVVGNVIPSTTQLKVSWDVGHYNSLAIIEILTDSDNFKFMYDDARDWGGGIVMFYPPGSTAEIIDFSGWRNVCGMNGDENCGTTQFIILDTTSLTEAQRTISKLSLHVDRGELMYEEV